VFEKVTALSPNRSTRRWEGGDVDECGWAFLSLPQKEQAILVNYYLLPRDEWEAYQKNAGVSAKKLRTAFGRLRKLALERGIDV
jgi:hypothetical protein